MVLAPIWKPLQSLGFRLINFNGYEGNLNGMSDQKNIYLDDLQEGPFAYSVISTEKVSCEDCGQIAGDS